MLDNSTHKIQNHNPKGLDEVVELLPHDAFGPHVFLLASWTVTLQEQEERLS